VSKSTLRSAGRSIEAIRRAQKLAGPTIGKAAEKYWEDMGVVTLTFYAYTRPDGRISSNV
jgi:hypothetical protein